MSVPIACTLSEPELRVRLEGITALAQRALLDHELDGPTLRLRYASEVADELERLVEQERECCGFLKFDLVRHPDGVHLAITAPAPVAGCASTLTAHFLGDVSREPTQCSSTCGCNAKGAAT
ncbi:hypothetical protein [Cupriavidus taiwanensis]|uniref:hypothetical protein n=1 Tax=Cupriavidus taiwanensis TaxID=164546 RepID=UPI000E190EBB|nr:hypothetical protein [Cupriavidus taiwanensis]SOY44427.1 conserved hypothetical protein [Cupriavidus taiwanensis]